jgi:predicted dehydrogenase
MKKLKAAVIGLGVGAKHAQIYNLDNKVDLVTLCDFNQKKLDFYKKKFPKCSFTNDENVVFRDPTIDIVSIASYDNFHFRHILKAIKYKKNFFVEKPFCLKSSELNRIISKLKKNKNLVFSSNLVLRTMPIFLDLKKKIKRNIFGKVYYCEGDYNYGRINKILNGWRGKISSYSVTLGGGIHLIDLIVSLIGLKVTKVVAEGNNISTKNSKFKNLDFVSAFLRFDNGLIVKISSNFGSVTTHHHILKIYGTKCSFFYDNFKAKYIKSRKPVKDKFINCNYSDIQKSKVLKSFIKSVYYKKNKNIVSQKEIINLMYVCFAIEKSLKTKKWEKVNYKN